MRDLVSTVVLLKVAVDIADIPWFTAMPPMPTSGLSESLASSRLTLAPSSTSAAYSSAPSTSTSVFRWLIFTRGLFFGGRASSSDDEVPSSKKRRHGRPPFAVKRRSPFLLVKTFRGPSQATLKRGVERPRDAERGFEDMAAAGRLAGGAHTD